MISDELQKIGYEIQYQVLNTADVTHLPQHRERIYLVYFRDHGDYLRFSFDFPATHENLPIHHFLEPEVNTKYYYGHHLSIWETIQKETFYQYRRYYVRENKNGVCPTLTANMGQGGHNVPLIKDAVGIRKLTPRECFNFQGFPPDLSDSHLYRLAGNAVSVPVIEQLAPHIVATLLR